MMIAGTVCTTILAATFAAVWMSTEWVRVAREAINLWHRRSASAAFERDTSVQQDALKMRALRLEQRVAALESDGKTTMYTSTR